MTIAELMSITGVSRSAFYQYFTDLHDLMETLLRGMEEDIFEVTFSWFSGEGDPAALLQESLAGLVRVCYVRGPILRAVADASTTDERLERSWAKFLTKFDDAVTARIEQHQAESFISAFDVARMRVCESAVSQAPDAFPLNGDVLEPDVFDRMILVETADYGRREAISNELNIFERNVLDMPADLVFGVPGMKYLEVEKKPIRALDSEVVVEHITDGGAITVLDRQHAVISLHVNDINVPEHDVTEGLRTRLEPDLDSLPPSPVPQHRVLDHDVADVVANGIHSPVVLDALCRDTVIFGAYEAAIHLNVSSPSASGRCTRWPQRGCQPRTESGR